MFNNLSENYKIAIRFGLAIAAYFIYTNVIRKKKSETSSQSSIDVVDVPNQRKLIGQISFNIKDKNWTDYKKWASSDEFIPNLRTLSESELNYLVSTFKKQPYDLANEPKAIEILRKVIN